MLSSLRTVRSFQFARTLCTKARKPGVSSLQELNAFLSAATDEVVVLDVRSIEEDGQKANERGASHAIAGTALGKERRPTALNIIFDRASKSMDLSQLPDVVTKSTPIITHCGSGGRGQKARLYLESQGFTNVLNGGGPTVDELWERYGTK